MEKVTLDKVKKSALDMGAIAGGMIASNILVKTIKQDNLIANGALAAGGLLGASVLKNKNLQMLALGAAAFGTLRCITIGVQRAVPNLQGVLPIGVMERIAKFLPSLNGDADDYDGEDFGDIDLDDDREEGGYSDYEEVGSSLRGAELLM